MTRTRWTDEEKFAAWVISKAIVRRALSYYACVKILRNAGLNRSESAIRAQLRRGVAYYEPRIPESRRL